MRRTGQFLAISALVLFGFSCAGIPERWEPPQWVETVPPGEGGEALLVAYGSGETATAAVVAAENDLIDQLSRVLLDRFDSDARGVSDKTAVLIEETTRARRSVLLPDDRYEVTRPDSLIETYLLFRYSESAIQEDLEGLRVAVEREHRPIRSADEPAAGQKAERPVEQTDDPLREIQLLLSSSPESPDAALTVLEQALGRASRFVFSSSPGEVMLPLGSTVIPPVSVTISGQNAIQREQGIALTVTETGPEIDGQRSRFSGSILTGPDGSGRYNPRAPRVSGVTRIGFQPEWLTEALARWRGQWQDGAVLARLDTLEARLSTTTSLRVTSAAAGIPTAVIMIDQDIAGNPILGRDAARGAFQQFRDMGYRAIAVDLSPVVESELAALTDPTVADLYDILPFDILASVDRVVLGTAVIAQFSESDGVTVILEVRAWAFDLRRDLRLASVELQERVTGRDARTTLRSAFNSAGRRSARILAPRLP